MAGPTKNLPDHLATRKEEEPELRVFKEKPAPKLDDTALNYEAFKERYAGSPFGDLTQEQFQGHASDVQGRTAFAEDVYEQDLSAARDELQTENRESLSVARSELNDRVAEFQKDLEHLGQGGDGTAVNYRNLAELSIRMLAVEGDGESAVSARSVAAATLANNQVALAPHLAQLDPEWWGKNYKDIQDNLPKGETGLKAYGKRFATELLTKGVGGHIVNTLSQFEQGAAQTVLGISSAIDQNDGVSLGAGLAHAGSSLAGIPGAAVDAATGGFIGLENTERLLTDQDGNILSADYDGDGRLNLREALGKTNELSETGLQFADGLSDLTGGKLGEGAASRVVGLADTIGLAAIDPLSWVSLGMSGRANAAIRTLEQSGDNVAYMAGTKLRNGASKASLAPFELEAATLAWTKSVTEGVMSMSARQIRRAGYKLDKNTILKSMFRKIKDQEGLIDGIVKHRLATLDDAVTRGSVPGLRVGGTTVVPMRRLFDAAKVIDSSLAKEAAWAKNMLKTADIGDSYELMAFVHTFDGLSAVSDDIKDSIKGWSALSEQATEDPKVFIGALLDNVDDVDTAFSEIETFGRALFDDRVVNTWREVFNAKTYVSAPEAVSGQGSLFGATSRVAEDASAVAFAARESGETVTAAAARMSDDIGELSLESARKLKRNLDVFEDPYEWMLKDFKTAGLRSQTAADTVVSRFMDRVADKFSPRAALRRQANFSEATVEGVDNTVNSAAAHRELFTDHVEQYGIDRNGASQLAQDVVKQSGKTLDEVYRALGAALRDESPAALATFGVAARQLYDVSKAVRDDIFDLSVASGADEIALLARKGYDPRVVTDATKDLAKRALSDKNADAIKFFEDAGVIRDGKASTTKKAPLSQQGHLRDPEIFTELRDVFNINEAAEQVLADSGIIKAGDGFKLYEESPIRSNLIRSRQAHEAFVTSDMIHGMSELKDTSGRPLAYVSKSADENADMWFQKNADDVDFGNADMVERSFPNGSKYLMDRNLTDEMDNTRRIIGAPNLDDSWKRHMESWNNIWGAYATVPLVGFGFHARNATGNLFNMMLAGFRDPRLLGDSAQMQQLGRRIRKEMNDTGDNWATAAKKIAPDEGSIKTLELARQHNIIGAGQTADLFGNFDPLNAGQTFNPLNQGNPVLASGRAFGTAIEDNARLALFMDGLQKGMDGTQAASRTRKFLFDYGDLTKFESENVRLLSRFYTFVRKNTALQARVLSTQPGAIVNAQRMTDEYVQTIFSAAGFGEAKDVEGGIQQDGTRIPDWAADGLKMYGQGTMAGIDTPFASFTDTLDAATAVLKIPAATALYISGAEGSEETMRDQLRHSLQLLSGGPVEGVRVLAEMTTGIDTFSGASFDDLDSTYLDKLFRLTDAIAPIGGKLDRELEYLGAYDALDVFQDEEGNDRNQGSLRLMNTLLGMTVVSGLDDDEQIRRNMAGLTHDLYEVLDQARDELGDDAVPSMSDLVDMGQVSAKNRAMQILMYRTVSGEPYSEEEIEALKRLAPASVLKAAGIDVEEKERAEWSEAEKVARVREQMTAITALGGEMSEDMLMALILRESGARISDVKALDIEPSFLTNSWLNNDDPEAYEVERAAAAERQLESLAAVFGISVEELQEQRPLLQPAERKAQQMRAAGYNESEIVQELITSLARQERAMLFGEDSLEQTKEYEPLTPEQIVKFERKTAAAEAELRVIMELQFGRQPTDPEMREWLSEVLLTSKEQRALGFENYTAPSTDNITTQETYDTRLGQRVTAVNDTLGVNLGSG